MILGLFAIAVLAVGGYLIYQRVNTAIDTNKTVAVTNVVQTPVDNAEYILHQQGLLTNVVHSPSSTVAAGLVISQNPSPGVPRRQADDGDPDRLDAASRRRRCRRS